MAQEPEVVDALLEPLLGRWEGDEPAAVREGDAPPTPETDSCPWLIRLTGWRSAWGRLPPGLESHPVGNETHAVGRLTCGQLETWIDQLEQKGAIIPARSLKETLQAHRLPPAVLRWSGKAGVQHLLDLSRPRVMGILNVTDDSFSGDGLRAVEAAVERGLNMATQGADLLDVGGESTRPGARPIGEDEELNRVIPVIQALSGRVALPISVDTTKPAVMAAALAAGASMINDVSALQGLGGQDHRPEDPDSDRKRPNHQSPYAFLAGGQCPIVLMHRQGSPETMQDAPRYHHPPSQVYRFLRQRIAAALGKGVAKHRLIVDPGIGFGKTTAHNLILMRRLRLLRGLGVPILLGVSRKRVVGALSGEPLPHQRDVGSHVLAALGYGAGAHLFRVHDVQGAVQALSVAAGWWNGLGSET